jgi:hypothetical protein
MSLRAGSPERQSEPTEKEGRHFGSCEAPLNTIVTHPPTAAAPSSHFLGSDVILKTQGRRLALATHISLSVKKGGVSQGCDFLWHSTIRARPPYYFSVSTQASKMHVLAVVPSYLCQCIHFVLWKILKKACALSVNTTNALSPIDDNIESCAVKKAMCDHRFLQPRTHIQ